LIVPDISWAEIALRLVAAAALTGAIGLEREYRERAAGLRTHMLVGVGSALFTIVSAYAWGDFVFDRSRGTVFDPTRIAAQIVTGIGFLGAGAIFRTGDTVKGITTASSIWITAAIGIVIGVGMIYLAIFTTVMTWFVLFVVKSIEMRLERKRSMVRNGAGDIDTSAKR
jgi:putative Mg2+ transporter-C (MgtC) family protein